MGPHPRQRLRDCRSSSRTRWRPFLRGGAVRRPAPPVPAPHRRTRLGGGYARGSLIFKEGFGGRQAVLHLSGSVRISRQVPGMGEEALAILKTGDYFGENWRSFDDFPAQRCGPRPAACAPAERVADLPVSSTGIWLYDLLWTSCGLVGAPCARPTNKMTF